jgi:formaldehyde-activating enzyme involved in methanogenesis
MMPSATFAPLLPIVNPLIVMVNADDGLIEAPDVVMTTAVIEVALHTAARPATLLAPAATVGVMECEKKLEGYVRVMVPPEGMAEVGVKARQISTGDLPTIRSEEAIVRDTDETWVIMLPDDTAFDIEHKFFRNLTPTEPFVGGPIVNPVMVMVTAKDGEIAAPDVVNTSAVAEVAPNVAVNPATLLAPELAEGVTDEAKKLEG